jgi:hypothetical protein
MSNECPTECKAVVTPSTRNGHRVFSYTLESHTAAAFAIMNELRLDGQLCDVTLRVCYNDLEAVDFVAHKVCSIVSITVMLWMESGVAVTLLTSDYSCPLGDRGVCALLF